jgi:peroxiredoxin
MLAAGDTAPDFVLPRLSGGAASLGDLSSCRGHSCAVLIAFLKVSCPVCQYTFPFLERLKDAPDVNVVGVSQDGEDDTTKFWRSFGLSFPVLLDREESEYRVSNAYRLTHVPSVFLIESGIITRAFAGFSRPDLEKLGDRFGVPAFRAGEKTPEFRPG